VTGENLVVVTFHDMQCDLLCVVIHTCVSVDYHSWQDDLPFPPLLVWHCDLVGGEPMTGWWSRKALSVLTGPAWFDFIVLSMFPSFNFLSRFRCCFSLSGRTWRSYYCMGHCVDTTMKSHSHEQQLWFWIDSFIW